MKTHPLPFRPARAWAALALAAVTWPSAGQDLEAGLKAVEALAAVNGRALACQDVQAMRRAKALMLAHAPKTIRFGSLYEERTNESYLAMTRQPSTCPDATGWREQLDAVARQLQEALPVAAPAR